MGAAGVPQTTTGAEPLGRGTGSSALGLPARNSSPGFTLHQFDVKHLFVVKAYGTSEAKGSGLEGFRLINEGKKLVKMLKSKESEGVLTISTEPLFRETSPIRELPWYKLQEAILEKLAGVLGEIMSHGNQQFGDSRPFSKAEDWQPTYTRSMVGVAEHPASEVRHLGRLEENLSTTLYI